MRIDTYAALDFDRIQSLMSLHTEYGKKLLRKLNADHAVSLVDLKAAYRRVKKLMQALEHNPLIEGELMQDLSHLLNPNLRALHSDIPLEINEIFELKQFIYYYEKIRLLYKEHGFQSRYALKSLQKLFDYLDPDHHKLPTFRISPAYCPALGKAFDSLNKASLRLKHLEEERLQSARKELNIPNLKHSFVISRMQKDLIEQLKQSEFYRENTENIANIGYCLTDSEAIILLRTKVASLKAEIKELEKEVLERINQKLKPYSEAISQATEAIAEIDLDLARASFGKRYHCSIPKLSTDELLSLKSATNLHLLLHLQESGRKYQSIDIELDTKLNILTGPNMGGKTTALKTIGQMALLARLGFPLPCSKASLPLYDFVWYNHDAKDQSEDLSSFGRETIAFVQMLKQGGRGLILLDEFGKGTNPTEGEAIATAVIEHLRNTKHQILVATHHSSPTRIKNAAHYSIKGFADEIFQKLKAEKATELRSRLKLLNEAMDYRISRQKESSEPPMCALKIAEILGMDSSIIQRANKLLKAEDEET